MNNEKTLKIIFVFFLVSFFLTKKCALKKKKSVSWKKIKKKNIDKKLKNEFKSQRNIH